MNFHFRYGWDGGGCTPHPIMLKVNCFVITFLFSSAIDLIVTLANLLTASSSIGGMAVTPTMRLSESTLGLKFSYVCGKVASGHLSNAKLWQTSV